MYFYTAAVGEVRWKECLSKEDRWIGSNTMEAFALHTGFGKQLQSMALRGKKDTSN
jgi:hypothetical protein